MSDARLYRAMFYVQIAAFFGGWIGASVSLMRGSAIGAAVIASVGVVVEIVASRVRGRVQARYVSSLVRRVKNDVMLYFDAKTDARLWRCEVVEDGPAHLGFDS